MKKILLIDDSVIQLQIIKGILQNDYEIMTVTSGLEAIALIQKQKPDLILLDYGMPVVDGKATLKMLREKEEIMDIPVIFLTGFNERENIEAVLELHPQGYLLKPVEPERLLESIQKVLGG